ncbi:calmodulin-like [Mizuhopecten yessoensis]|uniref:Calmodulin n=1 Tax=Mizuhopecten yessoensis TaxID=6573 RepID=A0A210Q9F7_MIZYE|nr:calmodulin-like [Mizuhopecten yessoensis]OWF45366.1 Calmodulin [Mizuhopecten yessoensis]
MASLNDPDVDQDNEAPELPPLSGFTTQPNPRKKFSLKPEDGEKPSRSLTGDELAEIRRSFSIIDANGDGKITLEELKSAAYCLGMNPTEEEAREMLEEADLDGDGCIDFEEYKNLMMFNYISIDMEKESMIAAFQALDKNGDGFISVDELRKALMFKDPRFYPGNDDEALMSVLFEADANGDGRIDYIEFVTSKMCSKVF